MSQLNPFLFYSPTTIEEAVDLYYKGPSSKLLSGGTFLINQLRKIKKIGGRSPEAVISLKHIPGLNGIDQSDGKLTINAATTLADIIDSDIVQDTLPILKQMAQGIGTTPLQNMATIGGNLTCRYTWTELPSLMIAADATFHFINQDKKETTISAQDFFSGSAKTNFILTHVAIPAVKHLSLAYFRATRTQAVDIPIINICIAAQMQNQQFQNVRAVINNGNNFAARDVDIEKCLEGQAYDAAIINNLKEWLQKDMYTKRSDEYKTAMFEVGFKHCLSQITKKK
ncbi:MAG: FAD binding domain-containing protein [Candidatus Omnitrophica bacterium]|nr:FAD binding domain-containing protein [Candidatus Omnitrophota bacterium]